MVLDVLASPLRLAELPLPECGTDEVLLKVGAADYDVVEFNRQAYALMHCTKALKLIPGATHLFEEDGTLERAANAAADWFMQYFNNQGPHPAA